MTAPVTLELKPEEVEYLNSLRRCALCDHLGALHVEDSGYGPNEVPECILPNCHCLHYK